jgi:hypothetical protein
MSGKSPAWGQQNPVVEKGQNDQAGILIRFKPNTGKDEIKKIQEKYHLEIIKNMSIPGLFLMKNNGEIPVKDIIYELKRHDEVIYAEPDYKYRINN